MVEQALGESVRPRPRDIVRDRADAHRSRRRIDDPNHDDGLGSIGTNTLAGKVGATRFTSLATLKANTTEVHAVQVDMSVFADTVPFPSNPYPPKPVVDLRLAAGGAAIDKGVVLVGLNDGFSGAAPDLGAYELGATVPVYGPRVPGTGGTGGASGAGGTSGGSGGISGAGGTSGSGGASGGASSTGGSAGTGGRSGTGGNAAGAGGNPAGGNAAGAGGDSPDGGPTADRAGGGCGCSQSGGGGGAASLALAVLMLAVRRVRGAPRGRVCGRRYQPFLSPSE